MTTSRVLLAFAPVSRACARGLGSRNKATRAPHLLAQIQPTPPAPSPSSSQVDGDSPPAPQALEEDESIEVELVELGPGLGQRLSEFEAEGYAVWVGLHAIAQGMGLAALYGL